VSPSIALVTGEFIRVERHRYGRYQPLVARFESPDRQRRWD